MLDPSIAADFEALKKLRRGQFSVVSRDLADKTWLVGYRADDGPVYYYAYDRANKQGRLMFSHQPKLEKLALARKAGLLTSGALVVLTGGGTGMTFGASVLRWGTS